MAKVVHGTMQTRVWGTRLINCGGGAEAPTEQRRVPPPLVAPRQGSHARAWLA